MMPDFIIIGAPRAGTTSIYHYLNQHPQIGMSSIKETNFFSYLASLEETNYDINPNTPWPVRNLQEYQCLFPGDSKTTGEASPSYLYVPGVPKQIRAHAPDVKLIAILRNPIDRAYSAYLRNVREGLETRKFEEALQTEWLSPGRLVRSNNYYIRTGMYARQLARYLEHFGQLQIKIFLYEDLTNSPHPLLASIFNFIGVDPTFMADTSVKFNKSMPSLITKRSHRRLIKSLTRHLRHVLPQKLYYFLLNVQTGMDKRTNYQPEPLRETRLFLRDLYIDDVKSLEKLLEQDLSRWLAVE